MTLVATCHCGATRIALPAHPTHAGECNCTYCARTGAVWAYYDPGELTFLARDDERMYSTSPDVHQHHFCGRCGMQTWGDSPNWAELYNNDGTPKVEGATFPTTRRLGLNLRLVDGLDWSAIAVEKLDGRNSW
jgi:hypothetical protein